MAKKLSQTLSLELISEETAGNYYHICTEMNPDLHPQAIFEHCWIASETDRLLHVYDRVVLVASEVMETLLRQNFTRRLEADASGDFRTLDPEKQQAEIIKRVHWQKKELFTKHQESLCRIFTINDLADYETAFKEILQVVKKGSSSV